MARKQSLAAALVLLCTLGFVSCKKPAASSEVVSVLAKKWEFTVGGKITGALALAGDGTLYASCEDGYIYALDPAGTLQWKTYVGPTEATPAIGSDGAIYVSNSNGRFFALNHSGSIRWTIDSYEGNTVNKSAGALGRDYLYGVSRGSLLAVRLDNGQIAWQSTWGGDQWGSVTLLPDGSLLSPGRAKLTALDSNGQVNWQYPAVSAGASPSSFFISSGIAIDNNRTLYATANRSSLVAMGLDGSVKWELKTNSTELGRSTPVVSTDGTIFFAGADATLYAVDPFGSTKWKLALPGPLHATPLLAQDGVIFVIGAHTLSAVSSAGRLVSQADVEHATESSPTLAPDGTVYVATSYDSKILAYAGGHGGLMNSPWPKYQADLSNSGTPHLF